MTRLLVVADTHAPRRWKSLPPTLVPLLEGADLVLHAGDVCVPAVLDELSAFAPVRVVLGNNDGPEVAAWGAPETLELVPHLEVETYTWDVLPPELRAAVAMASASRTSASRSMVTLPSGSAVVPRRIATSIGRAR